MIRSDCHMHSIFSSDSDSAMEEMVRGAIEKRLTTICFTEHMDYNFPDKYEYDFIFNPEEYFMTIKELISKYSDSITILKGVEIGLMNGTQKEYDKLVNDYPWDFVIGSTHLVDSLDPYYSEYWIGNDEQERIMHYFETVYENIRLCNCFDSIGHLDYILRYAPHKNNGFVFNDYMEIIDRILVYIIDNNIALEINTSGFRAGLNEPNPCKDIIRRYIDLGGHMYTIGSDAHSPAYIAGDFNRAEELLESLGIHEYSVYKNRKPVLFHI